MDWSNKMLEDLISLWITGGTAWKKLNGSIDIEVVFLKRCIKMVDGFRN